MILKELTKNRYFYKSIFTKVHVVYITLFNFLL